MDRRSRERFIESNNQIASLVEKFKIEGAAYRKYAPAPPLEVENIEMHQKVPLTAYGRAGTFAVLFALIKRSWSRMSPFRMATLKNFWLRLLLMPLFFFLLWIFYFETFKDGMDEKSQFQTTYVTRNGLIFNTLAGAYFMGIIITGSTCKLQLTSNNFFFKEGNFF